MACCYNITRSFVLFYLLIGIIGVVLSGLVDFWWKSQYQDKLGQIVKADKGLWRTCGTIFSAIGETNFCYKRKDFLKFKKDGLDLDIIVVSLIGSAFFGFISLILIAVSMCQKYPSRLTILFHLKFLLFAAVGGIFGLTWALMKMPDENNNWAYYCLYGANGSLVLAFVLSLVLLCVKAPGYYLVSKREDEEKEMMMKHKPSYS